MEQHLYTGSRETDVENTRPTAGIWKTRYTLRKPGASGRSGKESLLAVPEQIPKPGLSLSAKRPVIGLSLLIDWNWGSVYRRREILDAGEESQY